jgi:hypothetical protein
MKLKSFGFYFDSELLNAVINLITDKLKSLIISFLVILTKENADHSENN